MFFQIKNLCHFENLSVFASNMRGVIFQIAIMLWRQCSGFKCCEVIVLVFCLCFWVMDNELLLSREALGRHVSGFAALFCSLFFSFFSNLTLI
jgi:hypothetical protein